MIQQNEKFQLTNWEIVSVNPADKNWDWKDFFCFWAVNIQSIIGFSLIASLYIVYDKDKGQQPMHTNNTRIARNKIT